MLICNVYRPPNAQISWFEDLEVMIERAMLEGKDTVVMGDFNCNLLKPDANTNKLNLVLSEHGMVQQIKCPTRITQSTETLIDLMFTTVPDLFSKIGHEEFALSDHVLILRAWKFLKFPVWLYAHAFSHPHRKILYETLMGIYCNVSLSPPLPPGCWRRCSRPSGTR